MNPLFLLQGIGMAAVALLAVLYWKRRNRVPAVFFLWGGLSWFVAIVFKTIASAPGPQIITRVREALPGTLSEPLLWLYIGLLTGVFKCVVSLIIVSRIRRMRASSWRERSVRNAAVPSGQTTGSAALAAVAWTRGQNRSLAHGQGSWAGRAEEGSGVGPETCVGALLNGRG